MLIAVGILQLTKNNNNDDQAVKQAKLTRSATITITNDGMQPDSLLISSGTQVTWTNTDSSAHQIAADPYPKNDSIPGFNSNNLLLSKDSYSFTFVQPGTYHYHDQLNPLTLMGTVVVR